MHKPTSSFCAWQTSSSPTCVCRILLNFWIKWDELCFYSAFQAVLFITVTFKRSSYLPSVFSKSSQRRSNISVLENSMEMHCLVGNNDNYKFWVGLCCLLHFDSVCILLLLLLLCFLRTSTACISTINKTAFLKCSRRSYRKKSEFRVSEISLCRSN